MCMPGGWRGHGVTCWVTLYLILLRQGLPMNLELRLVANRSPPQ